MSEQEKNVKLNEDEPKETKSPETLDEGPPLSVLKKKKGGIKLTSPQREMLSPAGVEKHYRTELFLIPTLQ